MTKIIKDVLKENEQKIVKDSINIAMFRQDVGLAVIASIFSIMETDSSKNFSSDEIRRKVMNEVKCIDAELIQKILKLSSLKQYKDERIKLEKKIIKGITQ